jgi:Partial alpha/beta-hydrolase lipase region
MFASGNMDFRLLVVVLFLLPAAANLERHLRFFEYCSYHGYPVEDHIVSTQDNYNLQFYRIQGNTPPTQPRTPR